MHEFLLNQVLIPSSGRPRQPYAKRRVAAHSASTECFQCSAFCGCRLASFPCRQHRQAAGPCSPSCANNCAKNVLPQQCAQLKAQRALFRNRLTLCNHLYCSDRGAGWFWVGVTSSGRGSEADKPNTTACLLGNTASGCVKSQPTEE